ncbi:hypothetical protein F5144DRAFT_333202 [Chaetomium tenue]|uniref:Uncharacterized protein n=1 Tax=Chaetomium tenue TaxID=1854479 RepID=A0ACB7P0L1_9PEZI|nr:hypothetical protein F5144DRAFT_333202 [Chaetomium globosum]
MYCLGVSVGFAYCVKAVAAQAAPLSWSGVTPALIPVLSTIAWLFASAGLLIIVFASGSSIRPCCFSSKVCVTRSWSSWEMSGVEEPGCSSMITPACTTPLPPCAVHLPGLFRAAAQQRGRDHGHPNHGKGKLFFCIVTRQQTFRHPSRMMR